MVFGGGRKKQEEVVATDEESPANYDVVLDDDSSEEGDSVPPPPPGTMSKSDFFRDEVAPISPEESTFMVKEESSGDRKDNGISFLTENSTDEYTADRKEKGQDSNRRKKFFLIFAFIATLAILIGLTVKYAQNPSKSGSVVSSAQQQTADESFFDPNDEPVTVEPAESDSVGVVTATPVPEEPVRTPETPVVTAAPSTEATEVAGESISTPEFPTTAPSEDATEAATEEFTDAATDAVTDVVTAASTFDGPGEFDCVVDQMFASSSCTGGVTSATVSICLTGAIEDQFWQWINYPAGYEAVEDWGWLSEGITIRREGIPQGFYKIGLFGNGNADLVEYPLITSTSFQVLCSTR